MDCFKSKLTARWAKLRENGIIDAIFIDMDSFIENVGAAANYDYEKWFESFTKYCDKVDYHFPPDIALTGNWADQVNYLRDFLTKRIAWFDSEMGYTPTVIEETEAPVQTEAETVTE